MSKFRSFLKKKFTSRWFCKTTWIIIVVLSRSLRDLNMIVISNWGKISAWVGGEIADKSPQFDFWSGAIIGRRFCTCSSSETFHAISRYSTWVSSGETPGIFYFIGWLGSFSSRITKTPSTETWWCSLRIIKM